MDIRLFPIFGERLARYVERPAANNDIRGRRIFATFVDHIAQTTPHRADERAHKLDQVAAGCEDLVSFFTFEFRYETGRQRAQDNAVLSGEPREFIEGNEFGSMPTRIERRAQRHHWLDVAPRTGGYRSKAQYENPNAQGAQLARNYLMAIDKKLNLRYLG